MRVLTTNCALREHSGTEIVTIDLALGLVRRGHQVAVLAPLVGPIASVLRAQGVFVTDRPEDLPWKPDVIHGHHNHVLAAALASFPDVPALFVCHSSNYWFDGPLLLSRVRRFCAVDEACRARLASEVGCSTEEIDLLPNAVDLERFSPRTPLPARPRRALLLTKNLEHVAAVREAAREVGFELDEIGSPFGRVVDDLHGRLKQYDVVFATARMALEALAVGCAVVVVDGRGLAGLVTSSKVDEWRSNNFGLRLLTRKPTAEAIVTEIGHYDAYDAARVSHRIRDVASLAIHLDRVEAIYRDISTPRSSPDPADDLRALGRFIAQWLRRLGEGIIPENFDTLVAANKFATEHQAVVLSARAIGEENAALRGQLERLGLELAAAQQNITLLRARIDALDSEYLKLRRTIKSPLKILEFYASAIQRRFFARKV